MKWLLLLALTGCGFVTGGDEYRVADPISDDGAVEAASVVDGGHLGPDAGLDGEMEASIEAGDAGIDSPVDVAVDAAVDAIVDSPADVAVDVVADVVAEADACVSPPTFQCAGLQTNPPHDFCFHNNSNGATQPTVTPGACSTCETYSCTCLEANLSNLTSCSANASGGITANFY